MLMPTAIKITNHFVNSERLGNETAVMQSDLRSLILINRRDKTSHSSWSRLVLDAFLAEVSEVQ